MAALAKKRVPKLHTFAAGLPGAPDLKFARQMASYIKSEHHEVIVSLDEILSVLPDVIYSLESFDALLVRSSILNFLVARQAARFTPAVFSGEGGDELFAGYEYLKSVPPQSLSAELVDILKRLHNTALQRVDRCASANGTLPHVGFLDPEVVKYALGIPAEFKLHDGVEKWILRESVSDLLPRRFCIVPRPSSGKAAVWKTFSRNMPKNISAMRILPRKGTSLETGSSIQKKKCTIFVSLTSFLVNPKILAGWGVPKVLPSADL
jgi:asparagine synthetase B (glutamine-hydrolysing)